MAKVWRLPVVWEVYGTVEIEAETLKDAHDYFLEHIDEFSLPYDSYYVDDSFRLAADSYEELVGIIGKTE